MQCKLTGMLAIDCICTRQQRCQKAFQGEDCVTVGLKSHTELVGRPALASISLQRPAELPVALEQLAMVKNCRLPLRK